MQKKSTNQKLLLQVPNLQKVVDTKMSKEMCVKTMEMQGWRKSIEDEKIVEIDFGDGNSLFGVLDGHNGNQVSKFISRNFTHFLKENGYYKGKRYEDALRSTFESMDTFLKTKKGNEQLRLIRKEQKGCLSSFFENFQSDNIGNKTGSTANIVLITPTHFFIANAGDTRSILYKKKQVIGLSEDHKPQNKSQMNRIQKAGGQVAANGRINGQLNVSRGFGDFRFKTGPITAQIVSCLPDIKVIERDETRDKFILIACDGLWENYENSEQLVQQLVPKMMENNPSKALEMIFDANVAKQIKNKTRKGYDNMTAILIQFRSLKKSLTNSIGTTSSGCS